MTDLNLANVRKYQLLCRSAKGSVEWFYNVDIRWRGARDNAHEKLYELLKDKVPEVRAAAVFALGTFINSCDERTEHANNLDHAIAMHLLKAGEDGSPLVRKELVVALQYVVLAFESNFVTVSRAAAEEEEQNSRSVTKKKSLMTMTLGGAAVGGVHLQNLRSTLSPASANKRSGKDKGSFTLQPSSSSSCLDRLASPGFGIASSRNSGSLLSMSTLTFGNVYTKIFGGLVFLSNDPHPEVAAMASKLVEYLKNRAADKEAARASLHLESASMPSSPARPSFMMPGNINSIRAQPIGNVSTIAEESSESVLSTSADARTRTHRTARAGSVGRHPSGGQHAASSASSNPSSTPPTLTPTPATLATTPKPTQNGTRNFGPLRQTAPPQLTTNFIPWSAKYFTKQLMKHECTRCDCDHESERHWRREWLFHRNNEVRMEAEIQWDLLRSRRGRLDGPVAGLGAPTVFRNVPAFSPNTILFHPFSHEVVVAGQSSVSVWNSLNSRRISLIDVHDRKVGVALPSVTSLELINPHDESFLLVSLI